MILSIIPIIIYLNIMIGIMILSIVLQNKARLDCIMEGKETKYYKYRSGSGTVTIPTALAETLNWNHKDTLILEFDKRDGRKGLFLYKKEEKKKKK